MKFKLVAAIVSLISFSTTAGLCQTQDCSKALVVANENISSSVATQLSVAYNMSEGEWAQRKTNASANAVIYGVPVGASYEDYKNNVRQRAEAFHLDRFEQRAYAYATSGLNQSSVEAYKACLQSVQKGFYLFAGDMSDDTYNIHLINAPVAGLDSHITGALKNPINVDDNSLSYLRETLSTLKYADTWDKNTVIQPKDSAKEVSFTVDFGNVATKYLLLPPLKTKPARVEISSSGTYSLMHRVKGVPSQDCALGLPTGGVGGLPPNYVSDDRACISTEGKNLPSNFKIDTSSVSISAPGQACAWVVCPEASDEEAKKRSNNILDATQCKPRRVSNSFCFRIKLECPNAYDVSCTDNWEITGQAVETKEPAR